MGMTWTKEQQQVIDLRNRNILVSAAAGSGKTAVLVERIKELVLDKKHPVDIDHLLVVTFTKCGSPDERACSKSLGKGIAGESFRCEITAAGCTGAECTDYYHRQFLPLCASESFS